MIAPKRVLADKKCNTKSQQNALADRAIALRIAVFVRVFGMQKRTTGVNAKSDPNEVRALISASIKRKRGIIHGMLQAA